MDTVENQIKRVERLSSKALNSINRELQEYEDDVRQYLQECWNLKDLIKNDANLDHRIYSSIESKIKQHQTLKIIADLANRTKHYTLKKYIRKNAKILQRGVTINTQKPGKPGAGFSEFEYIISIDSGDTFELKDIIESSVASWKQILRQL